MWLGISIHCARFFSNSSRKLECSRRSRAVKYFYDVLKTLSTLLCMNAKKLVIQRKCTPFIGVYARLCRVPCFVILKRLSRYILHLFFPIFLLADGGLKARLEMIKNHAITVLQELKVRFISKLFLQTLERSQ